MSLNFKPTMELLMFKYLLSSVRVKWSVLFVHFCSSSPARRHFHSCVPLLFLKARWNQTYILNPLRSYPQSYCASIGQYWFWKNSQNTFIHISIPKLARISSSFLLVVTVLMASSINTFQSIISQRSPSSSYDFSPTEPRRFSN